MQELERAYSPAVAENAPPTSIRPRPTFTAEREAQDVEYAAAVRNDEDRDEEERQREEAVLLPRWGTAEALLAQQL